MSSENEPAKLLLPYLQRADELQKHEPLVAYYCLLYAMERGLRIPQSDRTKTTNSLLISLMNQLEKDKKSLQLGPDDYLHLEGFALGVFSKADKQDRAGRADLNTAKTFYAASIFFEIINQFGPLQPDLEQKQKYAVWKAADIRKALKEGRKPVPGPPGGGEDLSVPPSTPGGSYDVGTSATAVTGPGPDTDPSPRSHDNVNHYSTNVPLTHQFHDDVNEQHSADIPPPAQHDFHPPPSVHRSESFTQSQPSAGFPSHDFHPPPPPNRSENSTYSQSYHQQSTQEPQQHLPHNYPSNETNYNYPSNETNYNYPSNETNYNYPNFQSYPSFTETSLPSVPTHYPSYYQGSETSYSSPAAPPPATSHPSTSQYTSSNRNGTTPEPAPTSVEKYHYDCNYQPPPEKIAEAHKAARFAVGALAFDDVSVAVEHLKKSLELLTNPSAAGH